jgi:hypothetical protein
MNSVQVIFVVVLIGVGATAVMDAWLALLRRMGVRSMDFALVGRWVGHLAQGRLAHAAIARARPVPRERALGWLTHYAVGVAFAGVLVGVEGLDWARQPSFLPAVAVGVCTVVAPLLVMQPAMGAGLLSSKTPTPLANCLRSVANHAVFGVGLYLAASLVAWIVR